MVTTEFLFINRVSKNVEIEWGKSQLVTQVLLVKVTLNCFLEQKFPIWEMGNANQSYLVESVWFFFPKSLAFVELLLARLEDSDAAMGTFEFVLLSSALLEEESDEDEDDDEEEVLFSSALLEEESDEDDGDEEEEEEVLFSPALFISSIVCSKFLLKELNTPSLFWSVTSIDIPRKSSIKGLIEKAKMT